MTAAKDYAKALFMLTEELGTTESAREDIAACRKILIDNPSYTTLTDTPALPPEEKLSLIARAFATVDVNVRNTLSILCERHSVRLFPDIAKEYEALYGPRGADIIV